MQITGAMVVAAMRVVPQGAGVGVIEAEESTAGVVVVGVGVTATEAGGTLAVVVTLVGAQEEAINVASKRKLNLSLVRGSWAKVLAYWCKTSMSSLNTCLMDVAIEEAGLPCVSVCNIMMQQK